MNNSWLPGSSLTMVIISRPKSSGSRPIRDTPVLLFTIHYSFFFFFFFLMRKPVYSDFQLSSEQRAICAYLSSSLTSQNQREKVPNQRVRKAWVHTEPPFKSFGSGSLCGCIHLGPSIFRGPLCHHTPALGSCSQLQWVPTLRLENGK